MRKTVRLIGLTPEQYELVAALAVRALCTIASYQNSEDLREAEEGDSDERVGLDADEVIEMAYDNVLQAARSTVNRIIDEIGQPLITEPSRDAPAGEAVS